MIVARDNNKYITNHGTTISSRKVYEEQLAEQEKITEPTKEELIELGKQNHPYYFKDIAIRNIQNQLDEIDAFEEK